VLNDLEQRMALILRYFTEFGSFLGALRKTVKVVEDVVTKKFTFAISSPDEFLVLVSDRRLNDSQRCRTMAFDTAAISTGLLLEQVRFQLTLEDVE